MILHHGPTDDGQNGQRQDGAGRQADLRTRRHTDKTSHGCFLTRLDRRNGRNQPVTTLGNRLNERITVAVITECSTEFAHDLVDLGVVYDSTAPNGINELISGHDLAGARGKMNERVHGARGNSA